MKMKMKIMKTIIIIMVMIILVIMTMIMVMVMVIIIREIPPSGHLSYTPEIRIASSALMDLLPAPLTLHLVVTSA